MSDENKAPNKLSTDPYKGVRDFYPEDMAIQNYIFSVWKKVAEKYGYQEYSASILEPAELYRAKSGEEIVNEQTYTFTDRGDREVTIRPEMTPTVARMVAARKRELPYPLRWFSVPNLFRYEKPQRGRLREHWQLNVDMFGVESTQSEVEVIALAADILHEFGMKNNDFEIIINDRQLMKDIPHKLSKLIDKKDKMSKEDFVKAAKEITDIDVLEMLADIKPSEKIKSVLEGLEYLGVTNVRFDSSLMRGFDYYTGIVFEVFDRHPENRRSLFGGGRYDELLALFGNEKVPAFGFGMGDVTMRDTLQTYNLLPAAKGGADIYIAVLEEKAFGYAQDIAQKLREDGKKVALDYSLKKVGDQIKTALKLNIPKLIVIGETEMNKGAYEIRDLNA